MSYSNLINTNLNLAFRMLKDLAQNAVLWRHSDTDFNFATGSHPALLTQIPVKFISVESEKMSQEHNTVIQTVMIRVKELNGDVSALDKIQINGQMWKFSNIMKSDGYVMMAKIAREV